VIRNTFGVDGSTRAADRHFEGPPTNPGKEVVTVNSANGMLYSIIGYYAPAIPNDPADPNQLGKFYVVDGESEYHPAGTVRIQQAKARQRDGQFTMDIRGQVKPEGGDAIPANAVIDAGTAGIFTVPTTAAIGFVPVGGTPPAGADIGRFRLNLRTGNETAATIAPESVTGAATSLTRNAILAHTRISDIRDVTIPANIPVAPEAGAVAPATAVASLLQTANGTTNLAPGVTGSVGVRLAQQRVDLAITAPGALFAADFRALLAANPVLGLAIDPATIVATATKAGVVTALNPGFIALPDPAVAGGVLLEGGFRGQSALDLAGSTISVKLVNGTQQATVISGAFSTGLTFSNTSPGTVPTPVVPANTVVIGRDPGAGVPVEGFAAQVTGNVTIANRVANQSRLDITIANVPVAEFVNRTGLFVNGVVPANLDVAASGLTAEFLDANGNILAVSPYFTGAFQSSTLVTLSLSARDANLATVLRTATRVRIVQSIAQGNTFGTLDLVTLPITDAATAQINPIQVNQVAGLP